MNLLFASPAAGALIVEACQLRRQGAPFRPGDLVKPIVGVDFKVGNRIVPGSIIGERRVQSIKFCDELKAFPGTSEFYVVGWMAQLEGLDFTVHCPSLERA
ncbi:MAG TPA: hypothetical protein VFQ72_00955 [Candidatus Paceibacterota bacterium]|nr:hypothetical protein [Candidatus Paceibacterota bacterium]